MKTNTKKSDKKQNKGAKIIKKGTGKNKKQSEFEQEEENIGDQGINDDLLLELKKAEEANVRFENNEDYEKIKQ